MVFNNPGVAEFMCPQVSGIVALVKATKNPLVHQTEGFPVISDYLVRFIVTYIATVCS